MSPNTEILRVFQRDHTRMMSRSKTMEDLMHIGFITSDPLIIGASPRKSGLFPKEIIEVLESPMN